MSILLLTNDPAGNAPRAICSRLIAAVDFLVLPFECERCDKKRGSAWRRVSFQNGAP